MVTIEENSDVELSPRWKVAVVLTFIIGFTVPLDFLFSWAFYLWS
jgi:hypothetical protein